MKSQLAEAQSQAAEYKDGWQRSVAEFQNYRRRVEAEKAETYQTAVGSIIKRYLPVLDDMERAMQARPADLAWADGVELICRKLQSILEAEGLKADRGRGAEIRPELPRSHRAGTRRGCGERHGDWGCPEWLYAGRACHPPGDGEGGTISNKELNTIAIKAHVKNIRTARENSLEKSFMSKIIGIDLGTTNSVGAVMQGSEPVVISSSEGERLVPSVVAINKNHERLVGRVARNQAIVNSAEYHLFH